MFGNKISYYRYLLPVLAAVLITASQALAVETQGYFSVTQFSLDKAATPEEIELERKRNSPLNPDLIYRVAFGRAADVAELLKQGADPNTKNESKYSVLMSAITRKDEQAEPITRALLQYGANPNIPAVDGNYPITEVVKSGRADVLQALIDYKAVLIYVKDDKGRDLQTLAEARGDKSILDVLTPAWEAEKKQIEELKSPENFIRLIQEYAFLNCSNEYLNYYISTTPEGVDMGKFNRIIGQNLQEVADSKKRINYLFKITDKELYQINYSARKNVIISLTNYGSNHSRKVNGVGTDKDLNNRCWKIAKKWNSRNMDRETYKLNIER